MSGALPFFFPRNAVWMQERQRYSLCLKHTLNNLLQAPHFTKGDLDQIAQRLTPTKLRLFNPHATILGNHDVNVLMAALQEVGLVSPSVIYHHCCYTVCTSGIWSVQREMSVYRNSSGRTSGIRAFASLTYQAAGD